MYQRHNSEGFTLSKATGLKVSDFLHKGIPITLYNDQRIKTTSHSSKMLLSVDSRNLLSKIQNVLD